METERHRRKPVPVVMPKPGARTQSPEHVTSASQRRPMPNDGTRQLLLSGFWTLIAGLLAALATKTVFGGIGIHGPHTNAGWLSLMAAMMCLPFGAMLFLLGAAKWLRNRRLSKQGSGGLS